MTLPSVMLPFLFGFAVLSLVLMPASAYAYNYGNPGPGPWTGQIVDSETGEPLDGVVIVAVWNERHTSVGGWAGGGYFASQEVATGTDGRFVIAPLRKRLLNPFAIVKGPEFYVFKPGYGHWKFQGQDEWKTLDLEVRTTRLEEAWRLFNSEHGMVLTLPKLKTREERRHSLGGHQPAPDVPVTEISRLLSAIDAERISLGLEPLSPRLKGN